MTTKVLSVEIGQGITHVVEMDYEVKNPKIYNCFSFKTPEGVVADGIVKRNNAFTNLISMECRKRGITTNKIVYTITSSRIASRDVIIPMVKDRMIQNVVDANATEYFPVDMSQYHLVYNKLGVVKQQIELEDKKADKKDEKDEKEKEKNKNAVAIKKTKDKPSSSDMLKLNLLAVPNDLTKSYFDFSTSTRLVLRGIDYMGNSVYQATKNSFTKGLNVVVKIDTKSTLITMIQDEKIVLQRVVNYGMADAVEMVLEKMIDSIEYDENETEEEREEKKVTYLDAIAEMQHEQFIAPRFKDAGIRNGEKVSNLVGELREEVTDSFKYMIGNIGRVIDYYVSRHDNVGINSFTAIGGGADLKGMTDLLSNELGIQVKPLKNIGGVVFMNGMEKRIKLGEYAACIGAGIHTQNLIPAGMDFQTDMKDSILVPAIIAIGCVVISVGMAVFGNISLMAHQSGKTKLENQKQELAKYDTLEQNYMNSVNTYNSIAAVYNNSTNVNSSLVKFVEELEKKMPSTMTVQTITSSPQQFSMVVTVDDKKAAAKAVEQIRQFNTIAIGSVNTSPYTEDADNHNKVTFTLTATYKAALNQAEKTSAAAATTTAESTTSAQ